MRPDSMRSWSAVPNIFESARGLRLSDAEIDRYIDSNVAGPDRKIAHGFLSMMPANMRGDFIYLDPGGHLISNNSRLIRYAKITISPTRHSNTSTIEKIAKPATPSLLRPSSRMQNRADVLHPLDYASSCSPANPPNNPGGPYIRLVSQCGFATGWGFVNIPQGVSSMTSGDDGYLYFEIRGTAGNSTEGGLQYVNDGSIDPYLRSTTAGGNGYIQLNNAATRFFAGEILGIFHGVTPNFSPTGGANLAYTIVGALSSSQNPESLWVNSQAVELVNPAYLFYSAPADMAGSGVDPAGVITPCSGCSVSQVTSIAQGTNTYSMDGSYFGVDGSGNDVIQWLQVAFGEWTSACQPGASICPFSASADPYAYYGGPQYYPNEDISQDNEAPTGYGPYETYDGIDLSGGVFSSELRKTSGTFREPFPPLPCTADADGMCIVNQSTKSRTSQCVAAYGAKHTPEYIYGQISTMSVYKKGAPAKYLETFTYTDRVEMTGLSAPSPLCKHVYTFNPGDPKVQYNDPSLL